MLSAPHAYIAGHKGKQVRTALIYAFQDWFRVPPAALQAVVELVDRLHTASLVCVPPASPRVPRRAAPSCAAPDVTAAGSVDDIEDNSHLRRGVPGALLHGLLLARLAGQRIAPHCCCCRSGLALTRCRRAVRSRSGPHQIRRAVGAERRQHGVLCRHPEVQHAGQPRGASGPARCAPRALGRTRPLRSGGRLTMDVPDEMVLLHRGQGLDVYWRDQLVCPTEAQYREMAINSAFLR